MRTLEMINTELNAAQVVMDATSIEEDKVLANPFSSVTEIQTAMDVASKAQDLCEKLMDEIVAFQEEIFN